MPNDQKVAVFLMGQVNDWRKANKYYAERTLKDQGIPYLIQEAGSTEAQMEQIRAAAGDGYKVMVVCPEGVGDDNRNDYGDLIDEMAASGVRIILSETALGEDYTSVVYYSNNEIGEQAGTAAADIYAGLSISVSGYHTVAFSILGEPGISNARYGGYVSELPGIDPIVYDVADFTRQSGRDGAAGLSAFFGGYASDPVVYAQDDEVAMGLLEYIAESPGGSPYHTRISGIIGCGGSREFIEMIRDQSGGTPVLATTLYSPKALMEGCVGVAAKVLKGQAVQKDNKLISTIVTKDNASQHIDANSPY